MYDLLVKIMTVAALAQFGMSIADWSHCHSRQCVQQIEKKSRDILSVGWKPLSVFPEERKRFQ